MEKSSLVKNGKVLEEEHLRCDHDQTHGPDHERFECEDGEVKLSEDRTEIECLEE